MKKLATLATGGAIGYVVGARAGRDRYNSMLHNAKALWDGWPKDAEGRRSVNPLGLVGTGRIPPQRDEQSGVVTSGSRVDAPLPNETPVIDSALNEQRRVSGESSKSQGQTKPQSLSSIG